MFKGDNSQNVDHQHRPGQKGRILLIKQYLHLGGLVAVGFDPTSSYLLVVSHSGRGVFSVSNWDRVARDVMLDYAVNGRAAGIGPLSGQEIKVVGLDSDHGIYLTSPNGRIDLHCESSGIAVLRADD